MKNCYGRYNKLGFMAFGIILKHSLTGSDEHFMARISKKPDMTDKHELIISFSYLALKKNL
jgi:hypothetical protein